MTEPTVPQKHRRADLARITLLYRRLETARSSLYHLDYDRFHTLFKSLTAEIGVDGFVGSTRSAHSNPYVSVEVTDGLHIEALREVLKPIVFATVQRLKQELIDLGYDPND